MSDQEQYDQAWIQAIVMIHPSGDIHFVGGDRAPGDGDTGYLAAKYLYHASKVKELAATESQQLRAEIATLADEMVDEKWRSFDDGTKAMRYVKRMRQLSAVEQNVGVNENF